jgi:hypothetical protein
MRLQMARNEAPTLHLKLRLSPAKTRPDSNRRQRRHSLMAAAAAPLLATEQQQCATEELQSAHLPQARAHLQQGWLPRGLVRRRVRRALLPTPLLSRPSSRRSLVTQSAPSQPH